MASLPCRFGDGPAVAADSGTAYCIQPTLAHVLRIWWAFYWRNGLVAFVLGLQLGSTVQWLVTHGIVSARMRPLVLQVAILGISYIPAIFVLYCVVRKQFREFRIHLTSIADEQRWWTYTWRTAVYTFALSIAMSVPIGFVSGAANVISPTFGKMFAVFQSLLVAGAIGLFVIYSNILDEEIGDFCVGLIPVASTTPAANPEISPTAKTKRQHPPSSVLREMLFALKLTEIPVTGSPILNEAAQRWTLRPWRGSVDCLMA